MNAIGKRVLGLGRSFQGETGLADAAWAGEGDEERVGTGKRGVQLGELLGAANQRGARAYQAEMRGWLWGCIAGRGPPAHGRRVAGVPVERVLLDLVEAVALDCWQGAADDGTANCPLADAKQRCRFDG